MRLLAAAAIGVICVNSKQKTSKAKRIRKESARNLTEYSGMMSNLQMLNVQVVKIKVSTRIPIVLFGPVL